MPTCVSPARSGQAFHGRPGPQLRYAPRGGSRNSPGSGAAPAATAGPGPPLLPLHTGSMQPRAVGSLAVSNNGAPSRAGRGTGRTRVGAASLRSATSSQILLTAAITLPFRSDSPSLGRMETPGVMSALRPGTDRQEEEEEPRPGATGSAAGLFRAARRKQSGSFAAPEAGGSAAVLACRTEGARRPARQQLPCPGEGAGRGAARLGGAPFPEPRGRTPGAGCPLPFCAVWGFFVLSGVFSVKSQPGDKHDHIS